MDGFLLQDWTTIRANGAGVTVIQTEEDWLNVEDHADLIFWLEVRNVQVGGATAVILAYQTGPSRDEVLFSAMSTFPISATATPFITKVIDGVATTPPAAWVRWRLSLSGTPTSEWGATFRIHCAASRRRTG